MYNHYHYYYYYYYYWYLFLMKMKTSKAEYPPITKQSIPGAHRSSGVRTGRPPSMFMGVCWCSLANKGSPAEKGYQKGSQRSSRASSNTHCGEAGIEAGGHSMGGKRSNTAHRKVSEGVQMIAPAASGAVPVPSHITDTRSILRGSISGRPPQLRYSILHSPLSGVFGVRDSHVARAT